MDIKKLTNKKGKPTDEEKAFLVEEGAKYGIEPPTREDCPDCWRDMAIQIAVAMQPKHQGGTRLRNKNGVLFKGRVIINPLDEETLAWLRENEFPETLLTDED